MNKILSIALICSICAAVTACANTKDIGIIGGADGPTSIIVTENGESTMYEQISAQKAKEILIREMENAACLAVPLEVAAEIGDNWDSCH